MRSSQIVMKKLRKIWQCLEERVDTASPVARWRLSAGGEFGMVERFLAPNGAGASPVFPCPVCERDMLVMPCGGEFVAEANEDARCRSVPGLAAADVAEHAINWQAVLGLVGGVLGVPLARDGLRYGHVVAGGEYVRDFRRVPVRACFSDDAAVISDEAARWLALARKPALFLTARHHAVCGLLFSKTGCGYFALEDLIGADDGGAFVLVRPMDDLVKEVERHGLDGGAAGVALERIDRNLTVVAEQKRELIEENNDLKAMQAQGMFKFVSSVESADMRLFLAILAHGDQSKAARALGMRDSTFREQTMGWKSRGSSYRMMHSLIEWRKNVGGKKSVAYDDAVLLADGGGSGSHEALLDQVLEGLQAMNARNWPAVCRELMMAIQEERPG